MIPITVELFGTSRLASGLRQLEIRLPSEVTPHRLAASLADACPALVGHGISGSRDALQDGYVLNLNGTAFLGQDVPVLKAGDSLLLLSNQAGG